MLTIGISSFIWAPEGCPQDNVETQPLENILAAPEPASATKSLSPGVKDAEIRRAEYQGVSGGSETDELGKPSNESTSHSKVENGEKPDVSKAFRLTKIKDTCFMNRRLEV